MSEGLGDVGVVGDEAAALHKYAKGRVEFVEVSRGNHLAVGIQIFVGERGERRGRQPQSQNKRSEGNRWQSLWRLIANFVLHIGAGSRSSQ